MWSIGRSIACSICGSSVTTAYASSAARNSPAAASPSRRRRSITAGSGRRGDDHRLVEVVEVDLDLHVGAGLEQWAVEDHAADQVIGTAGPDRRPDVTGRLHAQQ